MTERKESSWPGLLGHLPPLRMHNGDAVRMLEALFLKGVSLAPALVLIATI